MLNKIVKKVFGSRNERLIKRLSPELEGKQREILEECAGTIISQVDSLRNMVNEFSEFARFPAANPVPQDLNAALEESISLYREAHREIEFDLHLGSDLPVVDFDREQIQRVLINLLENAVEAMGSQKGGKISVTTRFESALQLVQLEVADNGPGMTGSNRDRVFEPYFSTKERGTGLGLAIVKRIVSDHSGFIRVQSQAGEGTTFSIELPVDAGLARPTVTSRDIGRRRSPDVSV